MTTMWVWASTVIALITFVGTDIFSTWKGSSIKGFYEMVPFMEGILTKYGIKGMLIVKLIFLIIIGVIGYGLSYCTGDATYYIYAMAALFGAGAAATVYNFYTIKNLK